MTDTAAKNTQPTAGAHISMASMLATFYFAPAEVSADSMEKDPLKAEGVMTGY